MSLFYQTNSEHSTRYELYGIIYTVIYTVIYDKSKNVMLGACKDILACRIRVTELRHGWTSAQISKNFINFGTN